MNKTHCQICAREIKANTGTIAHHGYTRPGYGWQTESCMGAKYLPYEQSRDRIPEVLEAYKGIYKTWVANRKNFIANPPKELTRYWTDRSGVRHESNTFKQPENFSAKESLKIEKPSWYDQPYEREFNLAVHDMDRNIRDIKEARDFLQERYDNWKAA